MSQPTKTMWDTVLKTYSDVIEAAEEAYLSKAKSKEVSSSRSCDTDSRIGYNCSDEENSTALASLRARAWLALRRKLEEQTSDSTVLTTLRTKFEDSFRYDEAGVPRVWRPEDDIEAAFRKAKDEVSFSSCKEPSIS